MGGCRGVDEVGQDGSALEHAGLAGRADPLDPAAAALGLGAELGLTQDDAVSEGAFGGVVGGVDAGDFAEGPQRVVFLKQPGAEAPGLQMAAADAAFEQALDVIAQRAQLVFKPREVVAVLQVGAVGADDVARCAQQLGAQSAGGSGVVE